MQDLQEIMLTCKLFYSIGEMATLWKNVVFSRQKLSKSDVDNELKLLRMGRFKFILKIDVNEYISDDMDFFQKQTITRNLLKYCCVNDNVKDLSLNSTYLCKISMTLIEKCIMKLVKIEFGYNCRFNQEEIETILHTISNSRKLKSIGLSYASFTNISPKTIEEAVKSLEQICFDHSHLSEEQCVFISRTLD